MPAVKNELFLDCLAYGKGATGPSENMVLFVLWLSLMTGDGFNSGMWNQFTYASTQTGLGGTFLLQGCTTATELLQFTASLQSVKLHGFGILP